MQCPVKLTERAARVIKSKIEEAGESNLFVRFDIDITGVSGVDPAVEFCRREDVPEDVFFLFEDGHVPIAIEKKTARYFEGIILDYQKGLSTEGFVLLQEATA